MRSAADPDPKVRYATLLIAAGAAMVLALGASAIGESATSSARPTQAGATAAAPPPLVGVISTRSGLVLRPLDARTLAPLPRSWSRRVGTVLVRSPLGSGVAAVWRTGAIVIDTRTGRVLRRFTHIDHGDGLTLYWLGGERQPTLITRIFSCWSGGTESGSCGGEYASIGFQNREDLDWGVDAAMPEGLLISDFDPSHLALYVPGGRDDEVDLRELPSSGFSRVVADPVHDRVYVVTAAGAVAEIDDVGGSRTVSYNSVTLNGRPFAAAWAGQGRIALWGADGLGTIDTRTWMTHPITAPVTGALATTYGIAAWDAAARAGITVYRLDGTRRFSVLAGKVVRSAEVVGRYLYVRADHRYTVDLASGRVLGRAREETRLVQPSYVLIP